ncbi:hypothetical protein [Veronia nyctiphanis]|uniref:hypothetical protein n=1 Tax=Veronia nyctiphanis TaxID=1278244 RepID=UPI001F3C1C12|nr:hypothetical protein [Veronia nyctiphanis]
MSSHIYIEFLGDGFGTEIKRVDDGFYLYELDKGMTDNPTSMTLIPTQAYTRGNNLVIQPLEMLKPETDYFYAITNSIIDKGGEPISSIQAYTTLTGGVTVGLGERLDRASAILRNLNNLLFDTNNEVSLDNIVFSMAYTTQSLGKTLDHTKQAIVKGLDQGNLNNIWRGASNPKNRDLSDLYEMTFGKTTDFLQFVRKDTNFNQYVDVDNEGLKDRLIEAYGLIDLMGNIPFLNLRSQVEVTTGTVKLPYFLDSKPDTFLLSPFERATPNVATIRYILERGNNEDKAVVIAQLTNAGVSVSDLDTIENNNDTLLKLMGLEMKLADGQPIESLVASKAAYGGVGAPVTTTKVVTRYNPIPKIQDVEEVPFLLLTPKKFNPNKPVKLVVFQHPITASKEAALPLAPRLIGVSGLPSFIGDLVGLISTFPGANELFALVSGQGGDLSWLRGNDDNLAIIAIDHSNHGERCLSDELCSSEEPTIYLNLEAFPVGRDNLKQSTLDFLGLRLALSLAQNKGDLTGTPLENIEDLSSNPPGLLSHSYGGVSATHTAVFGNKTFGGDLGNRYDDHFNFSALALAKVGTHVSSLLLNSKEYEGMVKHIVALTLNPSYQQFVKDNQFACSDDRDPADCYGEFVEQAGNSSELTAVLNSVNETFDLYGIAAQTALDSIEPYNVVQMKGENGQPILADIPIFLKQVANDNTLPNRVEFSPLTGSETFAELLGLNTIDKNSPTTFSAGMNFALPSGDKHFVKYDEVADHLTFIGSQTPPADDPHSGHMQTTIAEFFLREDNSFKGIPVDYLTE